MEEWEAAATRLPSGVTTGDRFGPYRIEARIGAGGMGEVFRAEDTRLGRRVALKVSRVPFPERFEREARVLSALNHPHICTLFDVGPNYLVMELLEGQTLADRLRQGPLPAGDVLRYGAEIADALAEAHRAGIIHRDLKPQNIILTRHGMKVLDFGLAKASDEGVLTQTGAVVGTPAYMSPEQQRGGAADARSDLFSLGLVLHEMATGQRPVAGAPPSKTGIASLDILIAGLLEPAPEQRTASAVDARDRLRALTAPARAAWPWRAVAVAAVLIAAAGAGAWIWLREPGPLVLVRLVPFTTVPGAKLDPAFSPDGRMLAFVWAGASGTEPGVYVIRVGEDRPLRVSASPNDISPAWSPDGARLSFLRTGRGESNELLVVSVPRSEGDQTPAPTKVRDVQQPELLTRGRRPLIAWTPDGSAVVTSSQDPDSALTSLFRFDLDGGLPRRVIASRGIDGTPAFSPDGQWLAYSDFEAAGSRLFVVRLTPDQTAAEERQEVPGSRGNLKSPSWSPDGRALIWTNGTRLMEWRPGGAARVVYTATEPFQGMTAVWTGLTPQVVFSNLTNAAELHALPLDPGRQRATAPSAPFLKIGGTQDNPALSPDGRWLAFVTIGRSGNLEVWIAGPHGEDPRLLAPIWAGAPISWSPDSRHIAFHSRQPDIAQSYIVDVDADGRGGPPRAVTRSAFSLFGSAWSADAQFLFVSGNRSPTQLRVMRVTVATGEIEDLFEGASAQPSADGRYLLYAKSQQPGLFRRLMAEGAVASNPEEKLIDDYVQPLGFVAGRDGIIYVSSRSQRQRSGLRYYHYATRRSVDLAPPPFMSVPVLTLSPDERRLIFTRQPLFTPSLTRMEFERGD